MSQFEAWVWTFCALVIYFAPALNAKKLKHHNVDAIFALNLLLGWTFVGWVIALVWSYTRRPAAVSA